MQKGHCQHPTTRAAAARLGGALPESSNDCTRRETNPHISQATILWGAVTWVNQRSVCDSQNLHYAYRLPRLEIISLDNHPWQTIFKTTQWHILVHLTTSLPSLSLRALEYLSVENWVTVFGMLGAWGRETPSPPSCSFWLWMCWMQWWTRLRRLGFLSHLTDGACGIMFLSVDDAVIFLKPKESEVIAIKESLALFGDTSGLKANLQKCAISPICCDGLNLDVLAVPSPANRPNFLVHTWTYLWYWWR